MHDAWQAFIEAQGATLGSDEIVIFDDADTWPSCALADLSYLGLIRLSGEEAVTFLQGQVTNDVRELTPEHSQYSGLCSPKGRMLANFLVFQRDSDIFLQLPQQRLDATLKRLQMFVLRAKVAVTDASSELVRIGLAGTCAEQLLPMPPAASAGSVQYSAPLTIIRMPGTHPRFQIIGPVDAVMSFWEQSASLARPAGPDFWPLLDIRAGIPTVFENTVEAFVPQMANMHLIDGVSFTKGCYTGQEVVARMQYLGTLKRRMYLASVDAAHAPNPGDELFSATSQSGQGAGRVVDARPSPDGGYELLVVAEIAAADEADLLLGTESGPRLTLKKLPYNSTIEA